MTELIRAEFHCHTVYSHDSSNRIQQLIAAARERGIARLAITDHNTISGALAAKELDPSLVIVGEEILTLSGELLAYYVSKVVPKGLSANEAIARLKEQGAFIAIPHVFDRRRHGWRVEDLLQILPFVDALEVFNARCLAGSINRRAREFAQERGLPMIAGSDAHSLVELGLGSVLLPEFDSPDELRAALKTAVIEGRLVSPLEHLKASALIGLGRLNPWKKSDQSTVRS
jgi:predicted metal-dependent phosphoesterase TrpH